MFKKLFFTAAAAAAVSVPLAGVAWATPANNEPPGQRDTPSGQPGIPGVVGEVADLFGTNPHVGEALPPGQVFSNLKKGVTLEDGTVVGPFAGSNTPERYATAINSLMIPGVNVGDTLSPGLGIKSGTPACKSGRTGGNLALCN
jgi:hypothetical protein